MAKKKKRISKPAATPVAEPAAAPVLAAPPKSRGRRYAETVAWSAVVFWLFIAYRVRVLYGASVGAWISAFLSPSFQVPAAHTLDYSMGFLPRALSGQLLTFFTGGSITGQAGGAYFLTMNVITYGLLSLILGRLIEKAINAKNYLLAIFPLLIIFTPQAVWSRTFPHKTYDTLMLLFALAAFFLIRNEKLMWFAPVCACLGILTSYSFIVLFFPLVFAMQYYELIKSGLKRTRLYNLIATTASSFALEAFMLWALLHGELVSKYSYEEAITYLEGKAGYAFSKLEEWYFITGSVFGRHADGQKATFSDLIVWPRYDWFDPAFYVTALLICAPILIFTLAAWREHIKGGKGFWEKSPYMLFMLAPAIIFPVFLVYGDLDRLVSAVLFTQVLLLAYALFADGQNEAFGRLKEISAGKRHWLLYAAVLLGVIVPLMVFRSASWLIATTKQSIL